MTKYLKTTVWKKKTLCSSGLRFVLIYTIIVLCFFNSVLGQTVNWQYVTTIAKGNKLYYNKDIRASANKNLNVWQKVILSDNSFAIALEEWDCRNKRHITRQITFYRADQTIIGTKKQSDWSAVIPGSSADRLFRRVCFPAPTPHWALITVRKANLRSLPNADATVLRTAGHGEKFQIVEETEQSKWVNVIDVNTQEDYWLHSSNFKVLQGK
jgi:hypothetical protein